MTGTEQELDFLSTASWILVVLSQNNILLSEVGKHQELRSLANMKDKQVIIILALF